MSSMANNMSSPKLTPTNTFTILILLIISSLHIPTKSQQMFSRESTKEDIGLQRQKLSQLHFYFHDIVSGTNPTAVHVASATTTDSSPTAFGFVAMIDDPLTIGPDPESKVVGRAQGVYGSADLTEFALLMAFNFVFTEGEFNGSTLGILGRNAVTHTVREMPITGGTGVFRFARGYAEARTYSVNSTNGNAIVEYNVYVFHY